MSALKVDNRCFMAWYTRLCQDSMTMGYNLGPLANKLISKYAITKRAKMWQILQSDAIMRKIIIDTLPITSDQTHEQNVIKMRTINIFQMASAYSNPNSEPSPSFQKTKSAEFGTPQKKAQSSVPTKPLPQSANESVPRSSNSSSSNSSSSSSSINAVQCSSNSSSNSYVALNSSNSSSSNSSENEQSKIRTKHHRKRKLNEIADSEKHTEPETKRSKITSGYFYKNFFVSIFI